MVCSESIDESKENAIIISGLKKRLNNKTIIYNIDLDIPKNSIYSIIGPNGAGKTTLIRLILNLLTQLSQQIFPNKARINEA